GPRLGDRSRREDGRQVWSGKSRPAHFLEEDRGLHHAESAAAMLLRQREPEPPELRHLLPQRFALAARVVDEGPHEGRLHVLVEERARGVLQQLLIRAEREVHGRLPYRAIRSARTSLGSPSTRSPMMFFCTSDDPE